MIEEIRITNLGVIEEATVVLGPGLTVLTGETGAGKTMVLTALQLLMGGKADSTAVRTGAGAASVEGRIRVASGSRAAEILSESEALVDDDGSVVVLRTVGAGPGGRSRAYLGGRSVPQGLLTELAESFITVHGQSDQLLLRSAARQRGTLDAYAGFEHEKRVEAHRALWVHRTELAARLEDLVLRAQERHREAELLRLGLAEIEKVNPVPGEDVELEQLISRLGHVEELQTAVGRAHDELAGQEPYPGVSGAVQAALRALDGVRHHDPVLDELARRVSDVSYLLEDLTTETSAYVDLLAVDPARLAQAQARRAELGTVMRAYGPDLPTVLHWAGEAGLRLAELDDGDDAVARLQENLAAVDAQLEDVQAELTQTRTAAARDLSAQVGSELAGLAMAGARLHVDVRRADQPGPTGADLVEYRFAAHQDAPLLALSRAASGGELSRVMLALEVCLARVRGTDTPRSFVFDEVDSGIGGQAAVAVGRRLAALADSAQVVVVTHLAQVAAHGDRHLVVQRSTEAVHASDVDMVTGEGRIGELARMMSGQNTSVTARAHAAELLKGRDVRP